MPKHKILVLGEHSHAADGPKSDRAMNIACGVVIAVVIVAMIVATVVYFCVQKSSNGYDSAAPTGAKKVGVAPPVQATKSAMLDGADQRPEARFGPVASGPAPQDGGLVFPKLSAKDERELAKSHSANFTKNYPSGYKQAVLNDPKYHMIAPGPSIYGTADFFPYRGKEDEMIVKLQMEQAKKYDQPFNMSEDQFRWKNDNLRAPLV